MKKNIKLFIGCLLIVLFAVWTILVKTVDVREMGVSEVGLASFNQEFLKLLPLNLTLLKITDILMFAVIATALVFVGVGIFQWIKRKSLKLVDKEIFVLGCSYILIIGLYFLFDKVVVINNRPFLIEGELESSYPSSHAMTALFVFLSAIPMTNYLLKGHKKINITTNAILIVLCTLTVGGRVLSGAHWMSDIIGGALIAIGVFYVFLFFFDKVHKKKIDEEIQ